MEDNPSVHSQVRQATIEGTHESYPRGPMDEIRAAMRRLRKSLGPGHPRALTHQAYSGYLAGLIAYHSHLYYNEANPELTDAEFDEIW